MKPTDKQIDEAIDKILARAELVPSTNSLSVKMDAAPKFFEEAFVKLSKKYRRIIFYIVPNKQDKLITIQFEPYRDGAKMIHGSRVYFFDRNYNKTEITEKTK